MGQRCTLAIYIDVLCHVEGYTGPSPNPNPNCGRAQLLGGRKGHVALMDWSRGRLECELHLKETVRDVTYAAGLGFRVGESDVT